MPAPVPVDPPDKRAGRGRDLRGGNLAGAATGTAVTTLHDVLVAFTSRI